MEQREQELIQFRASLHHAERFLQETTIHLEKKKTDLKALEEQLSEKDIRKKKYIEQIKEIRRKYNNL